MIGLTRVWAAALVWLGAALAGSTTRAEAVSAANSSETTLRLHWAGMSLIARSTNGAYLAGIRSLPQSKRFEGEILDRLALFLAQARPASLVDVTNLGPVVSNTPAARLLRPLLGDVIENEAWIEAKPGQWSLAVRLNEAKATTWGSSLTAGLPQIPGASRAGSVSSFPTWQLPDSRRASITRQRGWTVVSLWTGVGAAPAPGFGPRLGEKPQVSAGTNDWIEGEVNLQALLGPFAPGWTPPFGWPKTKVTVGGDGQNIVTRAVAVFPRELKLNLEPWLIPTNYIYGELASFTAVRGLGQVLDSLPAWQKKDFALGTTPNQFSAWSIMRLPIQTTAVVPDPNAAADTAVLTKWLLTRNQPWFSGSTVAQFVPAENGNGVQWGGLPYLAPRVCALTNNGRPLVLGTFGAVEGKPVGIPVELQKTLAETNLVAYSWDFGAERLHQLVYTGQFIRFVFHKAQLAQDMAAIPWMEAAGPRLGFCASAIRQTGPNQLSFVRRATLGLSSLDLHLLVDWVESPLFPNGFHTLSAPAPADPVDLPSAHGGSTGSGVR